VGKTSEDTGSKTSRNSGKRPVLLPLFVRIQRSGPHEPELDRRAAILEADRHFLLHGAVVADVAFDFRTVELEALLDDLTVQ
jgi:hypothetical protein